MGTSVLPASAMGIAAHFDFRDVFITQLINPDKTSYKNYEIWSTPCRLRLRSGSTRFLVMFNLHANTRMASRRSPFCSRNARSTTRKSRYLTVNSHEFPFYWVSSLGVSTGTFAPIANTLSPYPSMGFEPTTNPTYIASLKRLESTTTSSSCLMKSLPKLLSVG